MFIFTEKHRLQANQIIKYIVSNDFNAISIQIQRFQVKKIFKVAVRDFLDCATLRGIRNQTWKFVANVDRKILHFSVA